MKYLIAGGYDTQNLGDYASFLGLYKLLKTKCPETQFTVLSRHPKDNFAQQFDVETILNLDHSNKEKSIGRFFNGFNEGDTSDHLNIIREKLLISDCLIIGNGRLFVDISIGYMRGPLSYFASLITLAKFLNKPVVLNSITLVEPSTDGGKEILNFILKNSTLVIVREESSALVAYDYIKDKNKVKILPDIAFAVTLEDGTITDVPEVFNESIGINLRGVNYSNVGQENFLKRNITKIENLLDSTDRDLVFCHQSTYDVDSKITDDRYVNKLIYDGLPTLYKKRCHIFNEKWTLAQTLGQYAKLSYLYTERRHGFILSLTQGTPSTLICHEKNTEVVKETVPIEDFFISPTQKFDYSESRIYDLENVLSKIRKDLPQYQLLLSRIQ
jgi:polysaccharide pyruvyl transferase WcaK-like protein